MLFSEDSLTLVMHLLLSFNPFERTTTAVLHLCKCWGYSCALLLSLQFLLAAACLFVCLFIVCIYQVYIVLYGEDGASQTKELQAPGCTLFRRNSRDTFILR